LFTFFSQTLCSAEEPGGSQKEDQDKDDKVNRLLQVGRKEESTETLYQSNNQTTDEGTSEAIVSSKDDNNEGDQDKQRTYGRKGIINRDKRCPGHPHTGDPNAESDLIGPINIYSHQHRRPSFLGKCADRLSGIGFFKKEEKCSDGHHGKNKSDQPRKTND